MAKYTTESLDLAAWLMSHGLELEDVTVLSPGRHLWALADPEGKAKNLAMTFASSLTADVLDKRKRLITIAKSGRHTGKKG